MHKWLNAVLCIFAVTPHAGVRIEISGYLDTALNINVTPHAGVRIEIFSLFRRKSLQSVTPHAGVRIEIICSSSSLESHLSPPTRGCELK